MPILIREGQLSLEDYWRFLNEANRDNEDWVPYPTPEAVRVFVFSDPLYDPDRHWVEVMDCRFVADLTAKIQLKQPPEAVIEVNIAEASRGRGLGEALLRTALGSLTEHDGPIRVILTPGNREIVSFAKAQGFEAEKMVDLERSLETIEEPQIPEGYRIASVCNAQLPELARLWNEIFGAGVQLYNGLSRLDARPEQLETMIAQQEVPTEMSVAFCGNEAVGFSVAQMAPSSSIKEGWVGQLGVRREHRRRGVGKALLLTSLLWLRRQGCSTAAINAMAGNLPALELYTRSGFKPRKVKEKHLVRRCPRERALEDGGRSKLKDGDKRFKTGPFG